MNFKATTLYWYAKRKLRKFNERNDGYSQYGQDRWVLELLGNPKHGVFMDIGANDGQSLSNSLMFEEMGWAGVCVEPHPDLFQKLKQVRKCQLVNACIADRDGKVHFLAVDGPGNMLSGIEEFLDERHRQRIDREIAVHGGRKRRIDIEALSPGTLMKRHQLDHIDYLSIDTEGAELMILKNFDLQNTNVKIIGVENGSRSPKLFHYLNSVGYELVLCVGCDEIYRRVQA